MKTKISDMMDYLEEAPALDLKVNAVKEIVSAESIKEATLKKIRSEAETKKRRKPKLPKAAAVVGALVLLAICSGTVTAHFYWNGFAYLSGFSRKDKEELAQQNETGSAATDLNGNVHYYDKSGAETKVLSKEEAALEAEKALAERKQRLQESSDLLDISALEHLPSGITEMKTDVHGKFEDFALGSGYMVILRPEDASKYVLKAGDTVAITVTDEEECILEFGMIRDGKIVVPDTNKQQNHYRVFTVPEDGEYNFYIMYYSANKGIFTDCVITVNEK